MYMYKQISLIKGMNAQGLSIFSTENNPKYGNTNLEEQQLSDWYKSSSEISGCTKIKNKLSVELPGNHDIIITAHWSHFLK